jgi:nucleoside phosphorylase
MLDAHHGIPEQEGDGDHNCYFLGEVGGHNVVIAFLPKKTLGSVSVSAAAVHMQHTFKHIRVVLLVGVGSGAPSASDDIRLGDVVVSEPMGSTGGVIRFERNSAGAMSSMPSEPAGVGNTDSGAIFFPSGGLDPPPMVLLTAMSGLRAEHEMVDSKMGEYLARAAKRYPKLRAKLVPPTGKATAATADRLYEAGYTHVGPRDAGCDSCDVRKLVPRLDDERPPDGGPAVHYGVIASGECDLRSGLEREQARQALGVKCFESAAAGLADNFPCLVIRGICDYADSHASNRWRSYAAATAAAYAMELLASMRPGVVQHTPTILDAMGSQSHEDEVSTDSSTTEADDGDFVEDGDEEEDTDSPLQSVKRAWQSDYFGSPLRDLRNFIATFNDIQPSKIYAKTVVFVQSSGVGKSRLAHEYGRSVCPMIGYCLRTNG